MYKWWIQRRCMWVRGIAVGLCVHRLSDSTSRFFNTRVYPTHTHTALTAERIVNTRAAPRRFLCYLARGRRAQGGMKLKKGP